MNVRGQRTRTRLIQATIDVVAEVGYARATTKAIAEAAGVAEGTIYRHFSDKRQLFYAAVFDRNAAVLDWIAVFPQRAGTGTVAGNLRGALAQLSRLRADLLPLELWLRSDPELSRDLAAAMAHLQRIAQPSPGTSTDGHLGSQPSGGGSPRGGSPADAEPTTPPSPATPAPTTPAPTDGSPPAPPPPVGFLGGVLPGDAIPGGISLEAVRRGQLPGPPQYVSEYLAAERDLGRIRQTADPDRVAVLLLVILFGAAMTTSAEGAGVDDALLGFAVDTVMDGIGVPGTA